MIRKGQEEEGKQNKDGASSPMMSQHWEAPQPQLEELCLVNVERRRKNWKWVKGTKKNYREMRNLFAVHHFWPKVLKHTTWLCSVHHSHLKYSELIELKHLNAFTPASFSPTSKSSKNTVVWKFKCWEKIRATAPVIQQWLNPLTTPLWLSMYLHIEGQWPIWISLSMKDYQHWHKTISNWPAPIKFQIQTKCCNG